MQVPNMDGCRPAATLRPRIQRGMSHARSRHTGKQPRTSALGLEAVHLSQQLVDGVVALVVAALGAAAARAADGIELVDEDDAGRQLARLGNVYARACGELVG